MPASLSVSNLEDAIVRALTCRWEGGIQLSADDLYFLASGFGITEVGELGQIIKKEDDPERETLMERLLFPDSSLRLALEPFLGSRGLSGTREESIAARLHRACPMIRLRHPGSDDPIEAMVSYGQAASFVSRLFLTRTISGKLCKALEDCRPGPEALSCRVVLRCKEMGMTPEKEALLLGVVREAGCPDFTDLFCLCAELLSDVPESTAPDRYIRQRRLEDRAQLKQIQRFEAERERFGMEYLMMTRFQVPPESVEAVTTRLAQMDALIDEVLCLPPLPEELVRHEDLGCFDPAAGLSGLARRLS